MGSSAKENCQAQSSSGFRLAEQTHFQSIQPPNPPGKAYFSAAANKISMVEQSRQPQPKLATQSQWVASLSWSELGTAQPQLVQILFLTPQNIFHNYAVNDPIWTRGYLM